MHTPALFRRVDLALTPVAIARINHRGCPSQPAAVAYRRLSIHRWTTLRVVAVAVILSLPLPALAGVPTYIVTDIGTLGGDESKAWGINRHGQVVGAARTAEGHEHAFLWLPRPAYGLPAGLNDLGVFPNGENSTATAINEAGQVVGWSETGEQNDVGVATVRAFLWESGVMTDLGAPPGVEDESHAFAINDRGEVVGRWTVSFAEVYRGFLWLPQPSYGSPSGMNDLGRISGLGIATASDINASGQVVGGATSDTGRWHTFLWLPEPAFGLPSGLNDMGTLGRGASWGTAIDNRGQVVGWIGEGGPPLLDGQAMLWREGAVSELGAPDGRTSIAEDLNGRGQMVGYSVGPGVPLSFRALLWDDTGMIELNDEIPPDSNWILEQARSVNNLGQIVGFGTVGSQTHAFLLTPKFPEIPAVSPGGLLVLILAVMVTGAVVFSRRGNSGSSMSGP